jgi:hypothetical protein
VATASRNFAIGPLLWGQLAAATSRNELERSAWDRGVVSAAAHYESRRSPLLPIQVFVASGAGFVLGSALDSWSLALQFLLGGGGGLLVFWTIPTLGAIAIAARAPVVQRNLARRELRAAEEEHRRHEAALRLRLSFGELGGVLERIVRYRELEAEPDERMRVRMLSECDPRTQLMEWASTAQVALANAGLHEQAKEFSVTWSQLDNADQIEAAYRHLRKIAEQAAASCAG